MSRGADLIGVGWQTLLDEHGVAATYTPLVGSAASILVLDNGTPEDIAQLAMQVDGVSKIVTATRTAITAAIGATVTIGATSYRVIAIRPRSEFAVDMMLGATVIAGSTTTDTLTVFWGPSTSTALDESGIQALQNVSSYTPAGNYAFAISGLPEKYLFFAWPDDAEQPLDVTGFETGGFNMVGDFAGTAEGYILTENGWPYKIVSVDGDDFRLYRTKYKQAASVTVTVTV